ncbi:filamentous hemagglutinin family outer membrane protein [Tolypothrix tenuis PCC 7101]|uniref:Filamentous hemagglutinin family outer membrane protein n=1 Tax=Tolypothrix tenuis PCC 7101 TaxID=231146 RepID=A0A1Z4N1G9_9CYAN|nr:S-layer family protein [Aulosira sp. FACHB-113]BAY99577.1 filamentous hemagglutinin family outer membrane protein [Tolypothrix tenuis PCC 7101]BAZ76501.1 filamentous hemagglutinin family outer membrane protein [Aulosira laxa NIES-50]
MKLTSVGFGVLSIICLSAIYNKGVHAQVTQDDTLKTLVTGSNNYTITNGTHIGNNLFHSFSEFSLPTGSSASFENATDIQNIFSRVTGGQVSNIDGQISAKGNANLFLLNPAGIIFGPNASLNIGGSFVVTTANSIKFDDGNVFSTDKTQSPLLTMKVPIGLQMGKNSGEISVQNSGHRLTTGIFTPADRSNNPLGLQVKTNNTLMLIGSAVNFSGGIVSADGGGHLEVGSLSEGQVKLKPTITGWEGDYSAVPKFNDIHLANQSLLDASGSNGSIQLQGRNLNLSDGSAILIQNFGARASEGIKIKASESLNLTGNVTDGSIGSIIQSDNLGTGQTGDITISAKQLSIQNGGLIATGIFNQGSGGNITANIADLIVLDGSAPSNGNKSTLQTYTLSSTHAGNLTVSSSNIKILDGAIFSVTAASGKSGIVQINAKDLIEIVGNNPITLSPATIGSSTVGFGNADDTLINTSRLVVRDGGFLGSTTLTTGSAGSVIINASEYVNIQGKAKGSVLSSRIVSNAEIADPITQAIYGFPPFPKGDAGSLTINTPSLRILDGAYTSVRNEGLGKAGDLLLNANSIFLDNQGSISASTASGNGGNIHLNLQNDLLMRHGSFISATSTGTGNGGNLSINSPVIVGLENSDIIANAVQGRGGNINITTQGILGLEYRSGLTSENDITASSQFGVNGTVEINNVGVDPNSGLIELPANITDSSQQIASGCNANTGSSFVATGRGGIPQNPAQEVRSDRTWSDIRDISAFHTTKPAQAQILTPPQVLVQATGWRRNANGKIELVADKSPNQVQTALTCAAVSNN